MIPTEGLRLLFPHDQRPKPFRRSDVLRRTPWFPVWWFDDLVARGYLVLDEQASTERPKYKVVSTG